MEAKEVMDVKRKAESVIKKCGTTNPFEIARRLHMHIQYGPLGGVKYANYLRYKRTQIIIIDSDVAPPHLLPFILAHEIGHALCTPDANTAWMAIYTLGNDAKAERTANTFAVELLLSDEYLREHAEYGIHELARMQGVPEEYVYLKSQY